MNYNLDNLSSGDLKELLRKIKLYRDLTKNLGNRGKKLFSNIVDKTSTYKVEYFPSYGEENAKKQALEVIKKVFGEEVKQENLNLVKKESLKGGIRVFRDDNLVDLSFSNLSKIFS